MSRLDDAMDECSQDRPPPDGAASAGPTVFPPGSVEYTGCRPYDIKQPTRFELEFTIRLEKFAEWLKERGLAR